MKGILRGIIGVVIILLGSIGYIQAQQSTLRTIIVDPGHGLPDPGAKGHYSNESDIILAVAQKLVQKLRDSLPGVKVIMTRTDRNLPGHLTSAPEANRWRAKFANENHGDLFVCIHANDAPSTTHRKTIGYRTKVYYTGKGSKRRKHTRRVPRYSYYKVPSTAHGTETYVWAVNKNDSKQDFVQSNNPDELYGEKGDSTVPMFSSTEEKILATLRTKKYFSRSLLLANLIEEQYVKQGRFSRGVKQRNEVGIWVLHATAMPSILTEIGFITDRSEEDYMNSQGGQQQIASDLLQAIIKYKTLLDAGHVH
ncbi:hypothetical protein GCM10027566_03930 [Arachidicoccus ginsenosidivorans]|jgi:N-acetylmuramoyl-L-alanine amidase